jgi:hypothetical protein
VVCQLLDKRDRAGWFNGDLEMYPIRAWLQAAGILIGFSVPFDKGSNRFHALRGGVA